MKIHAVVVGLDHWDDYTKPCLESIRATNPEMGVTCVDNGSDKPYGIVPGVTLVKSAAKRSYAGGINLGLKYSGLPDWYIILNNDVLFEKQQEWSQAEDVFATIGGYFTDLGLDSDGFSACLEDGAAEEKASQDLGIAMQNQFPPAPQFFAFMGEGGGYAPADQLAETLDGILAQ